MRKERLTVIEKDIIEIVKEATKLDAIGRMQVHSVAYGMNLQKEVSKEGGGN